MRRIPFFLLCSSALVLTGCAGLQAPPQAHPGALKMSKAYDANEHFVESVAHFPSQRPATGKNTVIFDPKMLAWAAYDHSGRLVRTGKASGGAHWCKDVGRPCRTRVGHFNVYRKGGPGCKSGKFPLPRGGAPMPHCMFFTGGFAIHASNDVPNYNASHGCVRVPHADAAWLHNNFVNIGTTVIVKPYR